jgi:hypothetical protein
MTSDFEDLIANFDELKVEDIRALWDGMDLETLGRVLRAHLVVEHFIDEWLLADGVKLEHFEQAGFQLMFGRKLQLLGKRGPASVVWKGLKQLNEIRNRFAHDPSHRLTVEDTVPLYDETGQLEAYLKAYQMVHGRAASTPVDIIEAFSEQAAALFLVGARMLVKTKDKVVELEKQSLRMEGKEEALASLQDDDE